jgi:hypothetical protein
LASADYRNGVLVGVALGLKDITALIAFIQTCNLRRLMSPRYSKELAAKIEATIAADYDKQKQAAIEDFRRWNAGEGGEGNPPSMPPAVGAAPSPSSEVVAQNGRSTTPSRRKMLLASMPSFRQKDFIRRDAEAEIFERWPQAKPRSEAEWKSFTSGIATLMTELVSKGLLEATEPENPFKPRVYRMTDKGRAEFLKEGSLLEP